MNNADPSPITFIAKHIPTPSNKVPIMPKVKVKI